MSGHPHTIQGKKHDARTTPVWCRSLDSVVYPVCNLCNKHVDTWIHRALLLSPAVSLKTATTERASNSNLMMKCWQFHVLYRGGSFRHTPPTLASVPPGTDKLWKIAVHGLVINRASCLYHLVWFCWRIHSTSTHHPQSHLTSFRPLPSLTIRHIWSHFRPVVQHPLVEYFRIQCLSQFISP